MMISTKGRYALRMLVDMAEHERGNTYVPLKEIAARQEISEKYLESIIRTLVKAKVVESLRGKGGGYRLTKNPEQYTVGSILRLTEAGQQFYDDFESITRQIEDLIHRGMDPQETETLHRLLLRAADNLTSEEDNA